ncbi:MAG: nucleotidyl transferase AbiEii/AbiGii toxin family protein [Candidatus Paceibacterota bacterium]|jgi:predicted nucleotidyltransferase component of viral defense system
MLNIENLEKFTKQAQTSFINIAREYCQHLFLSYLYRQPGSEKLLFKGGTALRIVFRSPRYSEDLDFTGINIKGKEVEDIFANTLSDIENTGIKVEIIESKNTTGGYLGIALFDVYGINIQIQIEVSLRNNGDVKGTRVLIDNDYISAYTLVHLRMDDIIRGKLQALYSRKKPRDFFDYFFLLSGNYSIVKEKDNLQKVMNLIKGEDINFRSELKKFLPASHTTYLKDFRKILEDKIKAHFA